jgi:hypothetical protein
LCQTCATKKQPESLVIIELCHLCHLCQTIISENE